MKVCSCVEIRPFIVLRIVPRDLVTKSCSMNKKSLLSTLGGVICYEIYDLPLRFFCPGLALLCRTSRSKSEIFNERSSLRFDSNRLRQDHIIWLNPKFSSLGPYDLAMNN